MSNKRYFEAYRVEDLRQLVERSQSVAEVAKNTIPLLRALYLFVKIKYVNETKELRQK